MITWKEVVSWNSNGIHIRLSWLSALSDAGMWTDGCWKNPLPLSVLKITFLRWLRCSFVKSRLPSYPSRTHSGLYPSIFGKGKWQMKPSLLQEGHSRKERGGDFLGKLSLTLFTVVFFCCGYCLALILWSHEKLVCLYLEWLLKRLSKCFGGNEIVVGRNVTTV